MNQTLIKAQAGLMRQFADRNPKHIAGVSLSPDCSEMTVKLKDVPLVYKDGAGRLAVGRAHALRFEFDDGYPAHPPVFSIGPRRPLCSHIWRNGTICLLQPAWYASFELPNAIIDLVGMLQGEEVVGHGADAEDSAWLSNQSNFRLRREMIGVPTRFVGLSWSPLPAVVRATSNRPSVMLAAAPAPTRPVVRLARTAEAHP
jgi:ubiquitin-protein ligase